MLKSKKEEQLRQNNLDLLYVAKPKNTEPDLKCHYARKENSVFVSGADYEKKIGKTVSIENIFKHNFIITEREGMYYSVLSKLAAELCGERYLLSKFFYSKRFR